MSSADNLWKQFGPKLQLSDILSCVCYVFVRVCLYVLCGHLLGKGWPLGSRLWCLLWVCHFPIGILGQVWYLIVSIPDLCTLTYITSGLIWIQTVWHSDGFPVRIFQKVDFEKISRHQKRIKNFPEVNELSTQNILEILKIITWGLYVF